MYIYMYIHRTVRSFFMVGGTGDWVQMLATMVGRKRKIKEGVAKTSWSSPPKNEIWTAIWNCFFENIISGIQFFYLSTRSSGHHQSFFYFRFSNRKSQSQQKLARKSNQFTIQLRSKNLTHFENLSPLDIENNMLPQHR